MVAPSPATLVLNVIVNVHDADVTARLPESLGGAVVRFADLDQVDVLLTDQIAARERAALEAAGPEVVVA